MLLYAEYTDVIKIFHLHCRADPLVAISIRKFTSTISEALGFIF